MAFRNDIENGIIAASAIGAMIASGELGLNTIIKNNPIISLAVFILLIIFSRRIVEMFSK